MSDKSNLVFKVLDMSALISVLLFELAAAVIIFGFPDAARSAFQQSAWYLVFPIVLPLLLVVSLATNTESEMFE